MSEKCDKFWKLFLICVVNVAVYLQLAIMGSIFPEEAASKGLTKTTFGFIFSVFPFVSMIVVPVAGYLIPKTGVKCLLASALCVTGVSQIAFGALDAVDDADLFTYGCYVFRALMSTGAATSLTCAIYLMVQQFKDNLGFAFAIQETAVGLGETLGPQVAILCRDLAGYQWSFYVTGFISLLIVPYVLYREHECDESLAESDVPKTPTSLSKLLRLELVPIVFAVVIIGVSFNGFPEPTLEPHLEENSISSSSTSLIFSGLALTFTLSSLITGKFADGLRQPKTLMILGGIVSAICYLCLGPMYFVISDYFTLNLVAMLVLGAALGVASVPSIGILRESLRTVGFEDSDATSSLVSALWLTSFTFGEFLGSSVSGYLVEWLSFLASTIIVAALNVISVILLYIQLVLSRNGEHDRLVESL
ncbi:MFS-type transporter SLC18B1 [Halotydeus destructor]|nr:MFS-type transporter SLC18B1 [Halotydeus destructor]